MIRDSRLDSTAGVLPLVETVGDGGDGGGGAFSGDAEDFGACDDAGLAPSVFRVGGDGDVWATWPKYAWAVSFDFPRTTVEISSGSA